MNEVADGETLLDHLVKQTTGTCHFCPGSKKDRLTLTLDRTILKDEALNILIAGRDTVSNLVGLNIGFD
jgi:hypothetical protein